MWNPQLLRASKFWHTPHLQPADRDLLACLGAQSVVRGVVGWDGSLDLHSRLRCKDSMRSCTKHCLRKDLRSRTAANSSVKGFIFACFLGPAQRTIA